MTASDHAKHAAAGLIDLSPPITPDLAVFPVLNWITSSITTPEALAPYPLLSKLMQTIEAHPRVVEYYRLEREREEGKVKEQQAVAAAAVAAAAAAAAAMASRLQPVAVAAGRP